MPKSVRLGSLNSLRIGENDRSSTGISLLGNGLILRFPGTVNFNNQEEMRIYKDPACGMDVDPKSAAGKSEYKGQTYYFCAPGYKQAFDKDLEKYQKGSQQGDYHHP